MFIESPRVPLRDPYAAKEKVGSVLPRQRVSVRQMKSGMRTIARCADEHCDPRRSRPVHVFQPPDESVGRISVHASVNDFRYRKRSKVLMSVNLGIQGGQEWEWSWRRDSIRFILNIIDNEAIHRERPKPHQLLGHDCFQLV